MAECRQHTFSADETNRSTPQKLIQIEVDIQVQNLCIHKSKKEGLLLKFQDLYL